jgi:hypothetical protein
MTLVYVTTKLPPSLHKALKREAKVRKIRMADAFRQALEAWLKK